MATLTWPSVNGIFRGVRWLLVPGCSSMHVYPTSDYTILMQLGGFVYHHRMLSSAQTEGTGDENIFFSTRAFYYLLFMVNVC